jgi:hypothetical protein
MPLDSSLLLRYTYIYLYSQKQALCVMMSTRLLFSKIKCETFEKPIIGTRMSSFRPVSHKRHGTLPCLSVFLLKSIQRSEFSEAIPSIVMWARALCFKIIDPGRLCLSLPPFRQSQILIYRKRSVLMSHEVGLPVLRATTKTAMFCLAFFHNSHTSRHIEERLSAC